MGFRQIIPLPSINPWSTQPFADAAIELASFTGLTQAQVLAQSSLVWWNDPFVSLGVGSGEWEWMVRLNVESETGVEKDLYTIGSAGNASICIGGPLAAPAPNFAASPFATNYQKAFCLTFKNNIYQSIGTIQGGNNSGSSRPIIQPSSPTLLADIYDAVYRDEGGTVQSWTYYYDKQTGSESINGVPTSMGTGRWVAKGTGWMAYGQANIFAVALAGACAIQSNGGRQAIQPPASWTYGSAVFTQEIGLITL